jgi:hypothetical protein
MEDNQTLAAVLRNIALKVLQSKNEILKEECKQYWKSRLTNVAEQGEMTFRENNLTKLDMEVLKEEGISFIHLTSPRDWKSFYQLSWEKKEKKNGK